MGMSTRVIGIKAPDSLMEKMLAVRDACEVAGVPLPAPVNAYFEDQYDPKGVTVNLIGHPSVKRHDSVSYEDGYEVDLKKLPPEVTVIRFVNSY